MVSGWPSGGSSCARGVRVAVAGWWSYRWWFVRPGAGLCLRCCGCLCRRAVGVWWLVRTVGERRGVFREIWVWVVCAALTVGAGVGLRTFVVQQYVVQGESMRSTLQDNDRVLVLKPWYWFGEPGRRDVVVVSAGGVLSQDLIKRVVAVPGDVVSYEQCVLKVNGREVAEPYVTLSEDSGCGGDLVLQVVAHGHVVVMGDNRGASRDSRDPTIGQVPMSRVLGRADAVVWPFSHRVRL
jgi:signal peptidase I